jgi:hypothetical protein
MALGRKLHVVIDPRQAPRRPVLMAATVRPAVGEPVEITILDLSELGFRATIPLDLREGMLLRVTLPIGRAPHARVVWVKEDAVGCEFVAPLASDEVGLISEIWDVVPAGPPDATGPLDG